MKKDKKITQEARYLTESEKSKIKTMFFGPYISEWKNEKGIVMNTDKDIADRLGVKTATVAGYVEKISEDHFKKIYKLRLKEIEKNEAREKKRQQIRNKSSSTAR